jgi:type IV pili sensor histidine kinase/response regulator
MSRLQGSPRVQDLYQNRSPEVVRYDRYTLASTLPVDAQRDPLNQIIDIRMPLQMVNTIGEGMRYVMLESGYSLCSGEPGVFSELFVKPLPAVQRSIGPVKLGDALQILAGPAWRMRVDDLNREICFVLRDEYRHLALSTTGPLQASVASQGTGKSASTGTLLNSSKDFLVLEITAIRCPRLGRKVPFCHQGHQKLPLKLFLLYLLQRQQKHLVTRSLPASRGKI